MTERFIAQQDLAAAEARLEDQARAFRDALLDATAAIAAAFDQLDDEGVTDGLIAAFDSSPIIDRVGGTEQWRYSVGDALQAIETIQNSRRILAAEPPPQGAAA